MNSFMENYKNTLDEDCNVSITENGAVGYKTSGKALLDLNYAVASLRNASEDEIISKFMAAFNENKLLAIKWLFFCRDCREGLGERRLFRIILSYLAKDDPRRLKYLIALIAEYGRFDDLWCLLDYPIAETYVLDLIRTQLFQDVKRMNAHLPISLIAKWLPSINASSAESKRYGRKIAKYLNLSEKRYRRYLSNLRAYLKVVETKMSAKEWSEIDYEAVPARANLLYNKAFLRNDEIRRREFLEKVESGSAKINASVLYPHDIVHSYNISDYYSRSHLIDRKDSTIEALWKALPDTVKGCGNTMVVADGSGSMECRIGKSKVTALEVANALAIYFSEHSSGQFKDKYITFSESPQYVDLSACVSLYEKLIVAHSHDECSNTNIEKVFDMILTTAIENHMEQDMLPQNILIISDMEFDMATYIPVRTKYGYGHEGNLPDVKLFNSIKQRFADAGYKMPRLVFWNVNSRTSTIPIRENELGVALVSGFSTNIAKMVLSGKLDAYECLIEMLNSERYNQVEQAWYYL